ncbi:MAG: hypothetical protein ACTSYR_03330 [Candidatus Odinarchaeia archaeon]
MVYPIIAGLLLIVGFFFTMAFLTDLPSRGNLNLKKTIPLIILISLSIGFGLHFLLLSLGA